MRVRIGAALLLVSGLVIGGSSAVAQQPPPKPPEPLKIKVGDHVEKGEALFSIYSRDVAASLAEHIEAHKDLDLAQKTFARTKDLFEHEAASRTAFETRSSSSTARPTTWPRTTSRTRCRKPSSTNRRCSAAFV